MRRALFLDRDGVLNVDHGYIARPADFDIMPGIEPLLRAARDKNYLLIVVTNQSGIARGYYSAADYAALEAHMVATFADLGIAFDGIYHCPHHAEGIVPDLSIACSCRKPQPGMILQAARDYDIDLAGSILVGDKDSDIGAARAAGVGLAFQVTQGDRLDAREIDPIIAALASGTDD